MWRMLRDDEDPQGVVGRLMREYSSYVQEPGPIDRARDVLARQVERKYPGWTVSHGIFGWTATRPGCEPVRSSSWNGFASGLEWREQHARELQERERSGSALGIVS